MWLVLAAAALAAPSPKLVVLVVVDQYSLDVHRQAAPFYTGGLARLGDPATAEVGVGRYTHACTWTAPGHATLATGATPAEHGIASNEWYEGDKTVTAGDPAALRKPSIGQAVTDAGRQVAAVSLKERGAHLLAGPNGQAAWLTKADKSFVWAGPAAKAAWLPDPVAALAAPAPAKAPGWPTRPATSPWESQRVDAFATPQAGTLLVDAAIGALGDDKLALGRDKNADLLVVSFSHIDYMGHYYTPESEESMLGLQQLDADLGRLLKALDERVGAGQWTLLLTADHGTLPTPAAYLSGNGFAEAATARFAAAGLPGTASFLESAVWFRGIDAAKRDQYVDLTLKEAAQWPEIAIAFDTHKPVPSTSLASKAAEACRVPDRSGDVEFWPRWGVTWGFEPGAKADDPFPQDANMRGTAHGSPWAYDTDVPVLVIGAGVKPGVAGVRPQTDVYGRLRGYLGL